MIIRIICVLVEAIILYILQTSVFTGIALAGVVPDLLLILVVAVAFMRGRIPAMFTGFFCGILIDCCYSSTIGLFALMYLIIGYLTGFAHRIYDENDYTLPLILTGGAELIYNLIYYLIFYLLSGKLNIGFYLVRFMIPKIIYTVLISVVLYKLLNACNIFLMRFDRDNV